MPRRAVLLHAWHILLVLACLGGLFGLQAPALLEVTR